MFKGHFWFADRGLISIVVYVGIFQHKNKILRLMLVLANKIMFTTIDS